MLRHNKGWMGVRLCLCMWVAGVGVVRGHNPPLYYQNRHTRKINGSEFVRFLVCTFSLHHHHYPHLFFSLKDETILHYNIKDRTIVHTVCLKICSLKYVLLRLLASLMRSDFLFYWVIKNSKISLKHSKHMVNYSFCN